jgi:hypothetical protein
MFLQECICVMRTLEGEHYVRLAPGAAEAIARYLHAAPCDIEELLLLLSTWPEEIQPRPLRARDGRLVAGDPVLLDATDDGLVFAAGSDPSPPAGQNVTVRWATVRSVEILPALRKDLS